MTASQTRHACVFGLNWGDEGKGKIVDLLCPAFDAVVRFNGGANAGHTVCVDEQTFALHLLPAGVLHKDAIGIIGSGVVVDPLTLLSEIDSLSERGIDVIENLRISERAHLVMPYHRLEDQIGEQAANPAARIGTTARGIGPCYADKARRRTAVRFTDLLHPDELTAHVRVIVARRSAALAAIYRQEVHLDAEAILADLAEVTQRLSPCITDTAALLADMMESGRAVLFEGANGVLLDVDHGTYPFVTSSSPGPHGIWGGAGVPPYDISFRIGITKAYTTRVGAGPFVSELDNEIGDRIRTAGKEFGTTTGRPRRCGWFDAFSCRYTARLTGATDIGVMHLDTLSGFDRIGLCVGYAIDGVPVKTMPSHVADLERAEPIIEYMPGWQQNLRSVRTFDALPAAAVDYIKRIEALVGVPVNLAGVGPDRSQTLVRGRVAGLFDTLESDAQTP